MSAISDFGWSVYFWTAKVTLESWSDFRSRGGVRERLNSSDNSGARWLHARDVGGA
jgi:hypothetical protein